MSADVFASVRRPVEPRPFPLGPLLTIATEPTLTRLALRVGASGATIHRAAVEGCTVRQADHWAVALGHHPAEVWDDWYAHPTEPGR